MRSGNQDTEGRGTRERTQLVLVLLMSACQCTQAHTIQKEPESITESCCSISALVWAGTVSWVSVWHLAATERGIRHRNSLITINLSQARSSLNHYLLLLRDISQPATNHHLLGHFALQYRQKINYNIFFFILKYIIINNNNKKK